MRASTPLVSIAEGNSIGQDAMVIVQDVSVIGADALPSRVLSSLPGADASVIVAELSLREAQGRCFFRTAR